MCTTYKKITVSVLGSPKKVTFTNCPMTLVNVIIMPRVLMYTISFKSHEARYFLDELFLSYIKLF